jgi:CDP-diacylglycerol--glycerol-3-phosphate 3-phosphatidyltransferase
MLTWASLVVSGLSAFAFASDWLALGGLLFWATGVLDLYDGRIARRVGLASSPGALLDSVCDRWAELLVYGGLALHFAGGPGLILTLAALAGSVMVSYVRARAEGLGVELREIGFLQRPERIIAIGAAALLAGLTGEWSLLVTLALIAAFGSGTAIVRFRHAFRALEARQPPPRAIAVSPTNPLRG